MEVGRTRSNAFDLDPQPNVAGLPFSFIHAWLSYS
jgi:hypothetical protein